MNFTRVGGRTFFLTVGCGVVNAVLLWFAKLDSSAYATITSATVGAYIAANAYQSRNPRGDRPLNDGTVK